MATRSEILLPGWMEFRFRLEARAKLKVEESAVSESVDLVKVDFEKQLAPETQKPALQRFLVDTLPTPVCVPKTLSDL
jgi:hypothetical protein